MTFCVTQLKLYTLDKLSIAINCDQLRLFFAAERVRLTGDNPIKGFILYNECYLKVYSLLDFAITLPDGVGVMIDFEVAMRAAWTELQPTHHVPLPFCLCLFAFAFGCLFHLTQVLKPWVEM